jgi:hypothetical protein
MATDPHDPPRRDWVEMPAATVWPMVLALGVVLLAAGLATNLTLSVVGAVIFLVAVIGWVRELLPGRGHTHEPLVGPERRARPAAGAVGMVRHLREGMPGYRFQLPEKVHPVSAGVKGGIVGGLVMPLPALLWGLISGHGIWYPVNLLAGMVLPGMDQMTTLELGRFSLSLLSVAVIIHAVISLGIGLMYGVLLPTLPGNPLLTGGLIMPALWTGASYGLMRVINPLMHERVDWPWFIFSQIVFGVAAALVVVRSEQVHLPPVGGEKGESAARQE